MGRFDLTRSSRRKQPVNGGNGQMVLKIRILLAITLLTFSFNADAAPQGIPSCYAANPALGLPAGKPTREVFVLADQTTVLDADLRQAVKGAVGGLLTPGTEFSVLRFSAFAQGRYMSAAQEGVLEAPISEQQRFHANSRILPIFDKCLHGQMAFGRRVALAAIDQSFAESSQELQHSDVLASIRDLSMRVKSSPARDKIVIIASDMLENSSISSFYYRKTVRRIVPADEMRKAISNNLIGNFAGARVYIVGAGLLPNANGIQPYRDPLAIGALREFWSTYFARSNARLIEMGTPALLRPVQ
jgi:hypothetical protein